VPATRRRGLLTRRAKDTLLLPAYHAEADPVRVELFYFDGCPGHAELRARLPRLLEQAEVDAVIEEHRIDSEPAARRERFLGSPTLRIDGQDIDSDAADRHDYGLKCRLYLTEDGLQRTPHDAWITKALRAAN